MEPNKDITLITIDALEAKLKNLRAETERVFNAIKYHKSLLNGINANDIEHIKESDNVINSKPITVPKGNVKMLLLSILDDKHIPLRMVELQAYYNEQTESNYNIREHVRAMNKAGQLKLMKVNNSNKHSFWVKPDWIEDNRLKDEYKWDDYIKLYEQEDITFV